MANWDKVYEGILDEAVPGGNGCMQVPSDFLDKTFTKMGYNHYLFGGWMHVYASRELSDEEIERYEKQAQDGLSDIVQSLSHEIDKCIIEEMKNKGYPDNCNKK